MNYQIVATLGPASTTEADWQAMLGAGVTAFRLNTSHLNLPQLDAWLARLSVFLAQIQPAPPVVLDLQGSKWRLGNFTTCPLEVGQQLELVCAETANKPNRLPVPHPDFFRAAAVSSGEIVLNDARVRLQLEHSGPDFITATVLAGHQISARKGITYTHSDYRQESLNERDTAIVARSRGLNFVQYAISYIKDTLEMAKYRAYFGPSAGLIAKLERQPAVAEAPTIGQLANTVWLCRGDLGAELGLKAMAQTAAGFADRLAVLPVPALLAGQVLEHMATQPTPTRAEVCHLFEALRQGYRGVVLSDETAIGQYPLEACRLAALFRA